MLDLKWRPKKFRDVIGNPGPVRVLLQRSIDGTLKNRSFMFGGPKGCGKTTLARIVAMAIHCDNLSKGEPCGECPSCLSVQDGDSSISFEEFDAATQGTVDKMREIVRDLEYQTLDGKSPVIILDEAHRLSPQAQDALLKPVEERKICVILCTTEPSKIRPTIRDRVEEYSVRSPSEEELITWISRICDAEKIAYDIANIKIMCNMTLKCPRLCLHTVDNVSMKDSAAIREYFHLESFEDIANIFSYMANNPAEAFKALDFILEKEGPSWVCNNLILASTSLFRVYFGSSPSFPVSLECPGIGTEHLSAFISDLTSIDKPNIYDLPAALAKLAAQVAKAPPINFSGWIPRIAPLAQPLVQEGNSLPFEAPEGVEVLTTRPLVQEEPGKPISIPQAASRPVVPISKLKFIEVDGIHFNSEERLTTLDDKIEKGSMGTDQIQDSIVLVEYDSRNIPISEADFSQELARRIRSTQIRKSGD